MASKLERAAVRQVMASRATLEGLQRSCYDLRDRDACVELGRLLSRRGGIGEILRERFMEAEGDARGHLLFILLNLKPRKAYMEWLKFSDHKSFYEELLWDENPLFDGQGRQDMADFLVENPQWLTFLGKEVSGGSPASDVFREMAPDSIYHPSQFISRIGIQAVSATLRSAQFKTFLRECVEGLQRGGVLEQIDKDSTMKDVGGDDFRLLKLYFEGDVDPEDLSEDAETVSVTLSFWGGPTFSWQIHVKGSPVALEGLQGALRGYGSVWGGPSDFSVRAQETNLSKTSILEEMELPREVCQLIGDHVTELIDEDRYGDPYLSPEI
jgi:hypothetical protein